MRSPPKRDEREAGVKHVRSCPVGPDRIGPQLSGAQRLLPAEWVLEGGPVIAALNRLVDLVEEHLTDEVGQLDVAGWARRLGTSEHHLRRMFSSLAGMPLSEYVRRRRMTVAAADVVRGDEDLLSIAMPCGYGSSEAFARAFHAVHGTAPSAARRDGGPLRAQPHLRFHLIVKGSTPMDVRIADRPAFRLVGHAARVPLVHSGVNPHIAEHVASIPAA